MPIQNSQFDFLPKSEIHDSIAVYNLWPLGVTHPGGFSRKFWNIELANTRFALLLTEMWPLKSNCFVPADIFIYIGPISTRL